MGKIFSASHKKTLMQSPAGAATFVVAAAALLTASSAADAASFSFTDSFASGPSSSWSNSSGNWTAGSGDYYAQQPSVDPAALSLLPFSFTNSDLVVTTTVNGYGDGGIVFGSPDNNALVLVLGGNGYGGGARGGGAGTGLYFIYHNTHFFLQSTAWKTTCSLPVTATR